MEAFWQGHVAVSFEASHGFTSGGMKKNLYGHRRLRDGGASK